ncbi:hypothetical protein MRX96_001491 [Rhipicephalus microplus]
MAAAVGGGGRYTDATKEPTYQLVISGKQPLPSMAITRASTVPATTSSPPRPAPHNSYVHASASNNPANHRYMSVPVR